MALNCKKQATSTSSSGDHAFHNNRVYSFEDVSLQSRSISKSSHELKNVFITISNILTSFTISQNFTLEEQTQFSYLRSLCDFGLNLIQDINTVDKLDYTLRHNNKQSTNPFYIVRDTSLFKLNDDDDNEFNLIEVLEFCLKMFQARQYFDHKNISFLTIKGEYEINAKTRISCINHIRLRQVIINLLSNSYKFTQRGEIKLHCFYNGNKKIRISIRDTGTGMSVSYIKSLFEPYSGDTINQKYNTQGTGLGLCIVKEILEAFNIELHYTSQTGKGTEFWFDLEDNSTFNHEDEQNNSKNNVIDQQALITQSILKMMDEVNSLDREGIILKQNELNSLNKSFEGSFDDNTEIMNDNNNNCINTLNHMFPKKQNFSYSKTTNTNLLQWNKKRETTCIQP